MSIDDQAVEATTSTATDTPAPADQQTYTREDMPPDPKQVDQESTRKSIKDTLRAEFDKQKREPSPARQEAAAKRAREEQTGKFAPEDNREKPRETAKNLSAKVEEPVKGAPEALPSLGQQATSDPASAPTSAAAAPASLSKDTRALWESLPEVVRNDIVKREADTQRGVEQLKARYQPLDEAIAPYRPLLQQAGKTDGDAIRQLFAWHQALAGPNKAQAFRALAQSHGIDLATLALNSGQSQQQDPNDPALQWQQALHGTVSPLDQRLSAIEQQFVRQQQAAVHSEIASFSNGKPYFDNIRWRMGQLMQSGEAASLDQAYKTAYDEIYGQPLTAERAKWEADAKAAQEAQAAKAAEAETERKRKEREALDKARRAHVSPRGSSPMGSIAPQQKSGKSIRDSIAEARREVTGSI